MASSFSIVLYDASEISYHRRPNDKINDKINDLERQIVKLIIENKYITIAELSKEIEKSEPTVHGHLDNLMKSGLIKRVGSRKTGYWEYLK